jgi:hypothetical protein
MAKSSLAKSTLLLKLLSTLSQRKTSKKWVFAKKLSPQKFWPESRDRFNLICTPWEFFTIAFCSASSLSQHPLRQNLLKKSSPIKLFTELLTIFRISARQTLAQNQKTFLPESSSLTLKRE